MKGREGIVLTAKVFALFLFGCGVPKKHLMASPNVRLNFSREIKIKSNILGIPFVPKNRRKNAWVCIAGISGPAPTTNPKDGALLEDFTYRREDLGYYTRSKDFTLTYWKKREFEDWPLRVHTVVDGVIFEAVQDDYFDPELAFFQSEHSPVQALGAISTKDADIRWVILKAQGDFAAQPPITVSPTYAYFGCVSDGKHHWVGTLIGFPPDVTKPVITVSGKAVALDGSHEQVVIIPLGQNYLNAH